MSPTESKCVCVCVCVCVCECLCVLRIHPHDYVILDLTPKIAGGWDLLLRSL